MTVEKVTRGDGAWYAFCYGYGRILRVRSLYAANLPDVAKRALVAKEDGDLFGKVPLEQIAEYNAKVGPAVLGAILHSAHDWDQSKVSADQYISDSLPLDVAEEIMGRIRIIIEGSGLEDAERKN